MAEHLLQDEFEEPNEHVEEYADGTRQSIKKEMEAYELERAAVAKNREFANPITFWE